MKKILFITAILILALFLAMPALAAEDIKVYVNGTQMSFPDQKPLINSDNRTLAPVRFISEALGAPVKWCDTAKKVTIEHQGKSIALVIGKKQATVGASVIVLDTAASIINSRTMVPLRFISEGLGANVEWNGNTRTIYITTGAAEPLPEAKPFAGTPTGKSFLRADTGEYAPVGEYMYVTADWLPIKFGETTIYGINPGAEYIEVQQSTPTGGAAHMLIIQDGIVIGGRTGYGYQSANIFTAKYDTKNRADEALGAPRVDINKVNAFVFIGWDKSTELYLIVKNPLNKGDWQP